MLSSGKPQTLVLNDESKDGKIQIICVTKSSILDLDIDSAINLAISLGDTATLNFLFICEGNGIEEIEDSTSLLITPNIDSIPDNMKFYNLPKNHNDVSFLSSANYYNWYVLNRGVIKGNL